MFSTSLRRALGCAKGRDSLRWLPWRPQTRACRPPEALARPVSSATRRSDALRAASGAGRVRGGPRPGRVASGWPRLAGPVWRGRGGSQLSSVEHRELWGGVTEVTPDGLTREVRWSSRWGLALSLGRLAESGEQAEQAPRAGDQKPFMDRW